MQEEAAPHSLSDRILNILEQLLQQGQQQLASDSSDDSDNEDDDAQAGVANQIVDVLVGVHLLNVPNYSEDAHVRLHGAELLPQPVPEMTTRFRRCRRRRRAGNKNVGARSSFVKKRSYSDEVLCRIRSRSLLRVRERTPP